MVLNGRCYSTVNGYRSCCQYAACVLFVKRTKSVTLFILEINMLTLKLFFTVCLMRAVFSFRDLAVRKPSKLNQRSSFLIVHLLPRQQDEAPINEILAKLDNLTNKVDNLTNKVDDLSTMLKTTQSTITNILAGITIVVIVIGGAKAFFESVVYLSTISL